jgi:WD40 repeat protein
MADITGMLQAAAGGSKQQYLAIGGSSFVDVYPWSKTGFGTKYSDPSPALGSGKKVAFSPKRDAIAVVSGSSTLNVYAWSTQGFGAKYTNPVGFPNQTITSVVFHPQGTAIVISFSTGAELYVAYAWSSSGFGAKLTTTTFTQYAWDLAFHPAGNAIAAALRGTTFSDPISAAWTWTSSGFGTKYADPSERPIYEINENESLATSFSPDGSYVVFGGGRRLRTPDPTPPMATTIGVFGYTWTSNNGFGPFYYAAAAASTYQLTTDLSFSPSGVAVSMSSTDYGIETYRWALVVSGGSSASYTYTRPSPAPEGFGRAVAFSSEGDAVAVGGENGAPYLSVYTWSDVTGYGTRFSNPATLPSNVVESIAFI